MIHEALAAIRADARHIDLSDTNRFTLALIEQPRRWRQRHVETLELESATEVRATSAYQIEFPPEMLKEFGVEDAEWANVVLPVTTKQKRPLLRFHIGTSHGAPAHLLNRTSNAGVEANYVLSLADAGPTPSAELDSLKPELLETLFGVTPQYYEQQIGALGLIPGIQHYLASGINLNVDQARIAMWLEALEPAAATILEVLREPADRLSSTENILIALPDLPTAPTDEEEIDELVGSYAAAIAAANEAKDWELLSAIGEYGRRWEMLVEVEVPLGRPCEITVAEDRPLRLEDRGWVWQRVTIGDARSAHVQVSVPDAAVELQEGPDDWGVRSIDGTPFGLPSGSRLGLGIFESVRVTRDTLALYTSSPERPFFVEVGFRLRPAKYIRWTANIAILVTLISGIAAIFITESHDLMERLAVLAIPTSIGAAIVLIREQSGLAAMLNRTARIALSLVLLFLWGVMLARVLNEGVRFHGHHPSTIPTGGSTTTAAGGK